MTMRRLIPHFLLSVMTLLAAGAVVVSVHGGERVSYFASPPSGNPRVVSIFHTVIRRTLAEPSFRIDNAIDYQSPDRYRVRIAGPTPLSLIEIGHELYYPLQPPTSKWGEVALTSNVASNLRLNVTTAVLTTLLHANSVVRDGDNNFTVTTVRNASSIDPLDPGQVEATMTVYVSDDLVTSIVTSLRGWMTIAVTSGSPPRTRSTRVSSFRPAVISYGDFGQVAPISAPPASQTAQVMVCDNGRGYKVQAQAPCLAF